MIKLSLYLSMLLMGSNFSGTSIQKTLPQVIAPAQISFNEQRFVDLINVERQDRMIGTLTINPLLVQVAREHSREMYEKNYFDHFSPTSDLKTPMSRYLKSFGHTPTWAYLGENLFYCSIVDCERGHESLMNSHDHRENILNDRFEQVGVGEYISPDGQYWVTELFLSQID